MVETKVTAATAAAVSTGFVLWVLQSYVFGGGAVPGPLAAFVGIVVLGVVTVGAGYLAPHTHRPDLPAAGDAPDEVPPPPRHRA